MKNINIKILLAFILFSSVAITSCYKESDWVAENADLSGKHYPIIQKTYLDQATYDVGATVIDTVLYWSIDEVEKLELYASINDGAEELYSSTPYTHNYFAASRTDVAALTYVVPEGTNGKSISLRVVVVNKNGLTSKEERITSRYKYDLSKFTVNE
jgi:hypothetical protein